MADIRHEETAALPVRSSGSPIHDTIVRQSNKAPADFGLERVSFTHLDGSGKLRNLSPLLTHETLNTVLTLLEEGDIG